MTLSRRMRAMVVFATLGLELRAAAQTSPLSPSLDAVPPLAGVVIAPRLDLNVSASSGYDVVVTEDTRPGVLIDPRLTYGSASSGLSGSLVFARRSGNSDFSASGGGYVQHYTSIPELVPVNYYGGANGGVRLGRQTHLRMSGGATYSPYYSFGNFLTPRTETVAAPRSDMNIARLQTYTAATSVELNSRLTQRLSMVTSYNADLVTTSNSAYRMFSMGTHAGMGYQATRYSQVRVGYGYRRSLNGTDVSAFQVHNIDAGLAYRRPLSFSRRTVASASTGTAVVTYLGGHTFAVIGNASLTHQLTQRSTLSLSYYRDISMVAGITRPFMADVVYSSFSGVLTKNLAYAVSGSYSLGRAMVNVDNGFSLASGTGSLRYRLTRYVPLFAEYFYYNYRFERPVGLEDGFPLLAQRHGLRGGVSYSLPVIGRRTP